MTKYFISTKQIPIVQIEQKVHWKNMELLKDKNPNEIHFIIHRLLQNALNMTKKRCFFISTSLLWR